MGQWFKSFLDLRKKIFFLSAQGRHTPRIEFFLERDDYTGLKTTKEENYQ
jgi:hypothetical protein